MGVVALVVFGPKGLAEVWSILVLLIALSRFPFHWPVHPALRPAERNYASLFARRLLKA